MKEKTLLRLSLQESNALKGIALIFLLTHHLFYAGNMPVDTIMTRGGHSVVQLVGVWCRVCVPLFVFLSGYGLAISSQHIRWDNLWQFYRKRYIKLMINYWFIYALFVPFGVFVMGRTFLKVYHGSWIRPIYDFFGLHYAFTKDYSGYNATWWFYSCIIILYFLFPYLHKFRQHWWAIVPFALLSYLYGEHIPLFHACALFVPSFVSGMYFADAQERKIHVNVFLKTIFLLIILPIICLMRQYVPFTELWDAIISLTLVFAFIISNIPSAIKRTLAFLGKHSFNIFLFHTFIYAYYFRSYIFWTTNPVLIFLTLLISSLVLSLIIEYLKERLGVNKLQDYLLRYHFL